MTFSGTQCSVRRLEELSKAARYGFDAMPQNMNEYSCDDVRPRESITPVQCDEIVSYHSNKKIFLLSLTVKEFEKSVQISQSYRYKFVSYFLEHSVHYL